MLAVQDTAAVQWYDTTVKEPFGGILHQSDIRHWPFLKWLELTSPHSAHEGFHVEGPVALR
jgi:hypothetical protein